MHSFLHNITHNPKLYSFLHETNYSISQPQQRSPANAYSGGGEVDCLSYCKEIMFFVSREKIYEP